MKQAALDYLVEELMEYDFSPSENTCLIEIPVWIFKEKLEKAREMEKENNINLLEKHLTEFNQWLDDNHTSFVIPDMILQDYIQTSKI